MIKWLMRLFKKKPVAVKKFTATAAVEKKLPKHYLIALKEKGVKEVKGDGDNPRVIEYHKSTSLKATKDSVPWCAAFINWCLGIAGIRGTNSARARSFETWGKETKDPQEGDLAVLKRGDPKLGQGHVTFFVRWVDKNKTSFLGYGGNQNDEVCYKAYPINDLLSFRQLSL